MTRVLLTYVCTQFISRTSMLFFQMPSWLFQVFALVTSSAHLNPCPQGANSMWGGAERINTNVQHLGKLYSMLESDYMIWRKQRDAKERNRQGGSEARWYLHGLVHRWAGATSSWLESAFFEKRMLSKDQGRRGSELCRTGGSMSSYSAKALRGHCAWCV